MHTNVHLSWCNCYFYSILFCVFPALITFFICCRHDLRVQAMNKLRETVVDQGVTRAKQVAMKQVRKFEEDHVLLKELHELYDDGTLQ